MSASAMGHEACQTFGTYLKALRKEIVPGSRAIGPFERRPDRVGRNVTQEELAEAVGISRVWYAMLEADVARRTSSRLLARLASAFSLSAHERAQLIDFVLQQYAE